MQAQKIDIKSLLPDELEQLMKALGEPKYRATQVFQWLAEGAESFDGMTNLPLRLREALEERCLLTPPLLLRKQVSAQDGTMKYLWQLRDGHAVETVLMQYRHGNSVCISTQVGCAQGCAFCASAIGGLVRNLEASEMLDEVLYTQKESGFSISNIVLMGIGEPLDNFDNVLRFLRLVNHADGLNIGMRHISLSTCGLTEKIDKLAEYNLQLTLSVSLHAPDDETRSRIMPANTRYGGVDELVEACARYYKKTGRRVSFEYAMIDGVNDSPAQAQALARIARRASAHVNLIPLNHVEERKFRPTSPEKLREFIKILEKNRTNVTLRRKLGEDIDASCGQLRKKAADREWSRADEEFWNHGQGKS